MSTARNNTKDMADVFRQMSKLSLDFFNASLKNNMRMANEMGGLFKNVGIELPASPLTKDKKCCPPEPYCPPHCILEITREAYAGELIVVPFAVKNTCGGTKTYRIGIRELVNQDGNPAPIQPSLSRDVVTLDPGQSINVHMMVNLMQGVSAGDCYTTEIVIRENKVNQNICFKLYVQSFCDVPTAEPIDEKYYFNHWQSWQSHFYCEKRPESNRLTLSKDEIKIQQG